MNMQSVQHSQQYIGIQPSLFGFATVLYDVDDGIVVYGGVEYGTESEAFAEASGWSQADGIPLDCHAQRVARQLMANPIAYVSHPAEVSTLSDATDDVSDMELYDDDLYLSDEPVRPLRRMSM